MSILLCIISTHTKIDSQCSHILCIYSVLYSHMYHLEQLFVLGSSLDWHRACDSRKCIHCSVSLSRHVFHTFLAR
jgi:hypothetical protein